MARRKKIIDLTDNETAIKARCLYIRRDLMERSTSEAARDMGYTSSSEVSKMESTAVRGINRKYIERLAVWSGVSLDFIYGRVDTYEICEDGVDSLVVYHQFKAFLDGSIEKCAKIITAMARSHQVGWRIENTAAAFYELERTFNRFVELNEKTFTNDMKGGATLVKKINELKSSIQVLGRDFEKDKEKNQRRIKMIENSLDDEKYYRGQVDLFKE